MCFSSIPESLLALSFDFDSDDKVDSRGGSSVEPSGTRSQYGYRSSSNSNCSSNCSISSSSSDSDRKTLGAGDLEADADSLMSRQSGLSTLGHMQSDGLKSVILSLNIEKLEKSMNFFKLIFIELIQ